MQKGFVSLIGLLIALILFIFLFLIITKIQTKNSIGPGDARNLEQKAQDTVDQYQQKGIENQKVDLEQ
ncbi:hypothetical protein A2870_01145 [Candidatus Curtissbacteria bacterium RIFCSPHIGHO2_01_FULL_41_11]|uniref:Uncharacterized protein n=1 Tax=Candidatus Curtissbacteria bacterium RIFCSPHIGHO2_01_FULL_41_11 TaxID=1797711 RepID=A0A1F5G8D3_9BACT|nr:MAG: hypothetical protein A2870_01145 [Candidatus Curtissbacteria bacterium RIFCSPHIGHO2_01_FULL_41_11]